MTNDLRKPSIDLVYMTRAEAKLLGCSKYFIGACSAGHMAERYVCNCRCVECEKILHAQRYATDPSYRNRLRANAREQYADPTLRAKILKNKKRKYWSNRKLIAA